MHLSFRFLEHARIVGGNATRPNGRDPYVRDCVRSKANFPLHVLFCRLQRHRCGRIA